MTLVRALVATGPGRKLDVTDVDLPDLGSDQVRVRVRAAGVCHSDLAMINGTLAPDFPLVLGHEAAGTVVAVGADVDRVRPGEHVVLTWAPPCRTCWFCANDQPWLCERGGRASTQRGATADGTPLHVTLGIGALADEVVVGEPAVVPVPDDLPFDQAALLGCAAMTGFGAVRNIARVRPGDAVAVIGIGGVGLSVIVAARAAGASPIVAVDRAVGKSDLALAVGATDFLVADDAVARSIRGLTGGRGADHAFECVGRSTTINTAWRSTRRGGQVTVVGMGAKDDMVSLSALDIYHSARILRAAAYGSSDPYREIPALAAAVIEGRIDLRPFITHHISLDEVPDAFDRMERGEGARSVVSFSG
jgi:S-(hydroxymethyl)glutathione dehydrogenase / alcohol dehydrogenase